MVLYKVKVLTGSSLASGTFDSISITLVGTEGEGAKTPLDNYGKDFLPGALDEYHLQEERDLGKILLIRLHKEPFSFFPEDDWYCSHVTVESPTGVLYDFPCYHWIEGYLTVEVPEGTAKLISVDRINPLIILQRQMELKEKQEIFKWKEHHPGFPRCVDVANVNELHSDMKYSLTKSLNFILNKGASVLELKLKGFTECRESWKTFDDLKRVFWTHRTVVSEYVSQHWKEDTFFGYQFLNGVDPMLIQKCKKIPGNFPVTDEMVASILGASTTLEKELQNGNIFIVDYKILEGVPATVINGKQQYMASPLCLLHVTHDKLMPLAIQINQTPGPENPIFLPSDNEWDWTLAKMWVRSSNFPYHQALSHYLRTHAFAEVFSIATFRQLPMSHPVYKLLIPHFRYTLQINVLARDRLISSGGIFDKNTAIGVAGLGELTARDMKSMTYASICLPDNLRSRGMDSLPNFYFRDDGMKIWSAVESYVSGIVDCYYKNEESIKNDKELQAWVLEIFKEGFRENKSSGIPSSLETRAELIKYLTMVIFTCSGKHAAVNSGQYDWLSWMPNNPSTMRQPPPTTKGTATLEKVLDILPDMGTTTSMMTSAWLLSNEPGDMRPLGTFPDKHFTEEEPMRCIKAFQERLSQISAEIERRNETLELKYTYLNPKVIENSVSI